VPWSLRLLVLPKPQPQTSYLNHFSITFQNPYPYWFNVHAKHLSTLLYLRSMEFPNSTTFERVHVFPSFSILLQVSAALRERAITHGQLFFSNPEKFLFLFCFTAFNFLPAFSHPKKYHFKRSNLWLIPEYSRKSNQLLESLLLKYESWSSMSC